jgi:hypothetical protein
VNLYRSSGHRAVRAPGIRDAAKVFSLREARRAFGRRGLVRILYVDCCTEDGTIAEFEAFIGYASGFNETTGRNVRFTVRNGGAE